MKLRRRIKNYFSFITYELNYDSRYDFYNFKDLQCNTSIESGINYNLTSHLDNKTFTSQEIETNPLKEINDDNLIEWFRGFTDGEGSFIISINKYENSEGKLSKSINFKFVIWPFFFIIWNLNRLILIHFFKRINKETLIFKVCIYNLKKLFFFSSLKHNTTPSLFMRKTNSLGRGKK